MSNKTTRGFFTVNTSDGNEWVGTDYELSEDEMSSILEVLQNITKLNYLAIPYADALGRQCKMYFNPARIIAVRFTVIP